MVVADHAELSITRQCALFKISRSTHYYEKKGESPFNLAVMKEIDKAFMEYPFFGVRQMRRYLVRLGYRVSKNRVRRLMRLMGPMPIYQKPRTSIPDMEHKKYPYLLKDIAITRSNQVWCTDITYIPMRKGFLYLVTIMDWSSRAVLSWRLSNTMDTDFCVCALEEALAKYGKPDIFNSDQGSQFTSFAFTSVLRDNEIRISMDGRGRCMDNVFIERLWRSLKYENVYLNAYETGSEAREGIGKWIAFYNTTRPHSALFGKTPQEWYRDGLCQAA
jgi:putative transposase